MIPDYCEKCELRYPPDLLEHTCLSEVINIRCPACKTLRTFHPVPIGVLLQPVVTDKGEMGLLVRRPATLDNTTYTYTELPSCLFYIGEDTKQVLVRETGIDIDSDTLRDFRISTNPGDKYLYLFFVNDRVLREKELLLSLDEAEKRYIITTYEDVPFLFPLEKEMVKAFFDELWFNEPER